MVEQYWLGSDGFCSALNQTDYQSISDSGDCLYAMPCSTTTGSIQNVTNFPTYSQTPTSSPRSAFSAVSSSYFSSTVTDAAFDNQVNLTSSNTHSNVQVPLYTGQAHATLGPVQQPNVFANQTSACNQFGVDLGCVLSQPVSTCMTTIQSGILPHKPAIFSSASTSFQTESLQCGSPGYNQIQSYSTIQEVQPLSHTTSGNIMTSQQASTSQHVSPINYLVQAPSSSGDHLPPSNKSSKQTTSEYTEDLSEVLQGINKDHRSTSKKHSCTQDVVFIGEVEKPELNDKTSDIIFVRKNFNKSGVVCLTPSRKLRKMKTLPYCRPISVDDDITTKCKVTISQAKNPTNLTVPSPSEWSYQSGTGIEAFDQETTSLLEYLYKSNSESIITISLPGTKGEKYQVNLPTMKMVNRNTSKEILLYRFNIAETIISMPPPPPSSDFPSHWSPQMNDIELVSVTAQGEEWLTIKRKMRETLPRLSLQSIQRIQNKKLWIRYAFQKAVLLDKNGLEADVNEKLLFHGTKHNPPCMIWQSEDGFDMRYCKTGAWGRGTYFAQDAIYSNDFAHLPRMNPMTSSLSMRQIFVASVLTGHSIPLLPDNTLERPPVRIPATASQPEVRYDSVTGIAAVRNQIYILYKFDMAYPSYLVTYSTR